MVAGFLDRIGGLLDKALLLAAVFPLLIIGTTLVVGFAAILGVHNCLIWLDGLPGSSLAALSAGSTLLLLLAALVLRSLRTIIVVIWSNGIIPDLSLTWERQRRAKLERQINIPLTWLGARTKFEERAVYCKRGIPIADLELKKLRDALEDLHLKVGVLSPQDLHCTYRKVAVSLQTAYQMYDGESLISVRPRMIDFLEERETEEQNQRNTLMAIRDLQFGPAGTLQSTRLGNLLQALDSYPFKRYRMEGGVFWHHLEQIMGGDLLEDVRNQRIVLDSLLALASLYCVLAVVAVFLGPWIWFNPWLWAVVGSLAAGLAYINYAIAIPVAMAMSRSLRAGCDLYHRKLLETLGIEPPEKLEDERAEWKKLSQLTIYGTARNLKFAPQKPPEPILG